MRTSNGNVTDESLSIEKCSADLSVECVEVTGTALECKAFFHAALNCSPRSYLFVNQCLIDRALVFSYFPRDKSPAISTLYFLDRWASFFSPMYSAPAFFSSPST